MANTAEQMEVFGYTPEGLDQEVEKYTGEVKKDFEENKLEEERRANHPLNNVPFFQRPVNASTDDIEVPTSDPDVRAFKNKFGETYTIATSPDQRVEREKLRDGIISSLEGIKGYLENPFLPDKEQVVDFVKGAAIGTLEQIKQSMESGATYGDIFGTLAGVGAASTPFKVPKGSLRLFGGVSMEGAAKDKNLKKAIGLLKDSDFYKFNRPASEEGGISYDLNKKIWSQTGWYVDPADGQWRYFIDDTKASLKNLDQVLDLDISPDARNPSTFKNVKISDVFDHPEFYKRYPEFKNLEVRFFNADPKKGENLKLLGSYDETRNIFSINLGADAHRVMVNGKYHYSTKQLKRTLLHELQHVIQRKENFIRGATTDAIPPDLVYDKDRELRGKKKPIQKKFDEIKSEFDRTDNRLKEARKAAGENPLPGLTIQQEIEIYNKHYSQPDKLRPDVTWASTAREYGVPVSVVQKAAGRTNLIGRLNRKLKQQGKVYNKLADEVYDVDRERSRIETNFYEGAGGEIEARLTEEMLDPSMTINQLESGATAKDVFPIDARAGMLEREGNLYEYQGKYGVDPFNYEVKPRREPESTNIKDTIKNKLGLAEGGDIMNEQMQMAFMDNGGLTDDGMNIDPVSGNDIPSGSMAEEVRDDIPAQLSEGEYVVPADVVRYYGVKFFEDLRDEAKRGLAEMEANGRIGGEPVPAGGPTDGPLTSEEMAVLEELGMAEGGVVNMYREQQNLYSPPNPAIGNSMSMATGGTVLGYAPGGLQPAAQQTQDQIYAAGQQAQQAAFTELPLGATVFPTQAQIDAGQTTPAIYQQSEKTTFFEPVELINTKPPYDIVLATTQKMLENYIDQEYVVNDGSFTPPVMGDSGGDGGGTTATTTTETKPAFANWATDVDWNSEDSIRDFVNNVKAGDVDPLTGKLASGAGYALAGIPGAIVGAALTDKGFLQSVSDLRASQLLAEAKGFTELSESIGEDIDSMLEGKSGITKFLADVFASGSGKSNGVIKTGRIDTTTTNIPKKSVVADYKLGKGFDKKKSEEARDKRKRKAKEVLYDAEKKGKDIVAKSDTGGPAGAANQAKTQANLDKVIAGLETGAETGTFQLNKGGLMTKGNKKK